MNNTGSGSRLSKIDTLWSVVRKAHVEDNEIATTAQQRLLELYAGAIRNYLIGSLRDEDLAEDLFQEFALKFVAGDFKTVDSNKGRFRSYVKTVLSRMVAGHYRKKTTRREQNLAEEYAEADSNRLGHDDDERFLINWRDDLLAKTWQRLLEEEAKTGAPYHSVLSLRSSEPSLNSDDLAKKLSAMTGKEMASGAARVALHRAREKFAKLMIEIVSNSLEDPTREALESELIDLQLFEYCRKVIEAMAE
jgi:RNA polymerase sigma-70 factor (ECF subfamily)